MESELGKAKNGFTSIDIAQTAYTVWANCNSLPEAWESADHFAWDRLATKAIRYIDAAIEAEAEISARALAGKMYRNFLGVDEGDPQGVDYLIWETIARHLVNCLDAEEGSIRLPEQEKKAMEWFRRKSSPHGVTA